MAKEPASICFVACIESGPLEAQTVRLVESIRRFGGALADGDVVAVTPRFGPPLTRATRRRLDHLGVRHERVASHPRYAWYQYLNTPLSLLAAEELTDADLLCWLDSDVLVLGEPSDLLLDAESDFVAGSTDNGVVGSQGPGSPHEPDWQRLCKLVGIDIDELPWVTTHLEGERIRFYLQAGVYAFRRGIGFPRFYVDMCESVLDNRFGFANAGENYAEQACLGLAVQKMGLRWRQLEPSHNYPMASYLPHAHDPGQLARAVVLHYHDSMQPHFWAECLARLKPAHPDVHAWLSPQEPLADPAPVPWRAVREGLRIARGVPRRRYRSAAAAA